MDSATRPGRRVSLKGGGGSFWDLKALPQAPALWPGLAPKEKFFLRGKALYKAKEWARATGDVLGRYGLRHRGGGTKPQPARHSHGWGEERDTNPGQLDPVVAFQMPVVRGDQPT
jgi:hypothetical protein